MTTQRTHEIGVRMALGATRVDILRLIANEGLRMVVVGLALGLGTALAGSRMLKALLFQASAYDPFTYIVVPLLLSLVALSNSHPSSRWNARRASCRTTSRITLDHSRVSLCDECNAK